MIKDGHQGYSCIKMRHAEVKVGLQYTVKSVVSECITFVWFPEEIVEIQNIILLYIYPLGWLYMYHTIHEHQYPLNCYDYFYIIVGLLVYLYNNDK